MEYYCIVNIEDITDEMLNSSLTTEESIRLNIAGTQGILKFDSKYANCMAGYTKYISSELTEEIKATSRVDWIVIDAQEG